MEKKDPIFTATVASVVYFLIYVMLKFFLQRHFDLAGGLLGAVFFWIVIFIVHQFLKKRYSE